MKDISILTTRRAADPVLSDLAKRLVDLWWLTPLAEDEIIKVDSLQKTAHLKRVCLLMDFRTYMVRFYIGGEQRNLGMATDARAAARFADMVRAYLWKYRTRGVGDPDDSDLNYSVARVKADLENETHAVALLKDIEQHLLKLGAIITPEERQRLLAERKEGARCNRTLGGQMEVMVAEWAKRFDAIDRENREIVRRIDSLQQTFDRLIAAAQTRST